MTKFFNFVERNLTVIWQRLEDTCSNDERSLGIFRIIWGLYLLLFIAPYTAFVGQVPQAFYNPPVLSLASLFPGFPPYWLMLAGDLLRIWLLVLITIGIKTRYCTIIFCLLTFFSESFLYSLGKINHGTLVWAVALCLAFTNWGVPYALVPDRRVNSKTATRVLATAGVLIAFGFFTGAFDKAVHWINFDLSTGGFLGWFYGGYYVLDRKLLLAPLVFRVPPQSFKVLDYAAVAFELSPFFFLFAGRIAWRAWLLVAICFHLANALLLNISFYNLVLVYLPFVALARCFGRLEVGVKAANAVFSWRVPLIICPIILGAALTAQRLNGGGSPFLFIEGRSVVSIALYVSLMLMALCGVLIAIDLTRLVSSTRLYRDSSRRAVPDDAHSGPDMEDR